MRKQVAKFSASLEERQDVKAVLARTRPGYDDPAGR